MLRQFGKARQTREERRGDLNASSFPLRLQSCFDLLLFRSGTESAKFHKRYPDSLDWEDTR